MDYFNFYTITLLIAIISLSLILVYFAWIMQYQDAGTPYPPVSAAEPCPDRWQLSEDKTKCLIPAATGINVGTIHTDDSTYSSQARYLPGAIFGTYTSGSSPTFVPVDMKNPPTTAAADFRAGNMYVDMGKVDICDRKKWANTFSVIWDGVSNYTKC
jgi:hypothetical protein